MTTLPLPALPFCPERVQNRELLEEFRAAGVEAYKDLWDCWRERLLAVRLDPAMEMRAGQSAFQLPLSEGEEGSILCLWLDEGVECTVDALWGSSPSRAYGAHLLAMELCMTALRGLTPEVTDGPPGSRHCAPLAAPSRGQARELKSHGLLAGTEEGKGAPPVLLRRYAILTWMPFRGGCGSCALRRECPRRTTEAQPTDFR